MLAPKTQTGVRPTLIDAKVGRVLVTGAGGFVGRRLADRLIGRFPNNDFVLCDREPVGMGRSDQWYTMDVSNYQEVTKLVEATRPSSIIHLAAVSAVTEAANDQSQAWQVNVLGTLNVVMAIQALVPDCHLTFISSAEVYGRSAFSGDPVGESAVLSPANPYAVTKAAADLLVQEATGRGLRASILRPFNHTGPGQAANFAIPSFCRQIALIEVGEQTPIISVGELDDERDFLDVDDVIGLYEMVLVNRDKLPNGLVLNVASGRSYRIGDLLKFLLAKTDAAISVEVEPSRLRAARVPRIVGNPSQAARILNWRATTPIETTLVQTLNYWRGKIKGRTSYSIGGLE